MTSRADPTILERILDGREPLLDLMSEYRAAIEQEVRDDIRARVEALVNPWPGRAPARSEGWDGFDMACERILDLLDDAAISSSSATEPCSFEACDLPSGHSGDHAFTPHIPGFRPSATETQDGERHEHEFRCLTCDARFRKGERVDGDAARALAETQDGERPVRSASTPRLMSHAALLADLLGYAAGRSGARPMPADWDEYVRRWIHTPRGTETLNRMARATPTPDDRDRIYPCGDPDCEQPKPHTIGPNWHGANTWTIAVPDDRDREVECVSCDDDHDANIHDHHWHDLDKTTYIGMEHGRELTDSEEAAENATWD